MNIKHFLSAAAALTMLAACSEYDPGESGNVVDLTDAEIKTIQEYTENFVERYGEMDPNHTWGFGELAETEEIGTRASDPKSNMWITITKGRIQEKDEQGNLLYYYEYNGARFNTTDYPSHVIDQNTTVSTQPLYLYNGDERLLDFTIEEGQTIPGFPVHNYYLSDFYNPNAVNAGAGKNPYPYGNKYEGWYHCMFGNENVEHWFRTKEDLLAYAQEHRYYEIIPLGDVAVCNDLADPEVADVYAEFSKVWTGTNPDINLTSYFVQQVWTGNATYTDKENGGTIIGGVQMNYLAAYGNGYIATDSEHFYNFNRSNYSNGNTGMMRIYDSNTQNFSYHNSYKSATIWNRYRLVYLHGNWYVGFDFALEDETYADHIYNDWIVKIVPGDGNITIPDDYKTEKTPHEVNETRTNTLTRRVMCEDLGTTDDFDFNDVVFDVTYSRSESRTATYNKVELFKKTGNSDWVRIGETEEFVSATDWASTSNWTGQITLLASGGTLPIYVQNFNTTDKYECHTYLLGESDSRLMVGEKYNPINVGANVDGIAPKVLPVVSNLTSTNPDDINIYVYTESGEHANNQIVLPKSREGQYDGTSKAPQKLCVPNDTRWMKEYQQIESVYTYFRNWVQKDNGDYNFGGTMDWTKNGLQNTNRLY